MGNYVLVEIKEQDGIDELISILPVESIAGQVEYVSSTFARITIVGAEYPVSSGDLVSNVKVDDYVLCHIYDGEVIAVEILQELTGKLMGWNKNTREVSIALDKEQVCDIKQTVEYLFANGDKYCFSRASNISRYVKRHTSQKISFYYYIRQSLINYFLNFKFF